MGALALGLALVATPAVAQDDVSPQEGDSAESIVVTGSRIARTGFDQPTPVSVVGGEQIARQAAVNVAQVLNEIPSFRPQATPSTNAIFANNIGASTADLRGLGANRTLVLINGRRVVASTVAGASFANAGAVDMNIIPTSLVQRVDVVTGGASAAYGSDAVAGVVNVVLDTDFTGIKGSSQYGINDIGDGEEYQFSLAGGTSFAGGRGHIIAGVEYSDSKGARDCYSREWCALGYNTVSNPVPGRDGIPAVSILPYTTTATASANGLIPRAALAADRSNAQLIASGLMGMEFRPDGTLVPHDYGTFYGVPIFQSGGGDGVQPFYMNFPIATPVERLNAFTHMQFELSDTVRLFAEGSYSRVKGSTIGAQRRDLGDLTIQADNAFLPDAVAQRMSDFGVASMPFGRVWNDLGPQQSNVTRETYRAVVGINAQMWGDWSLDAYYQFGQTDYSQRGRNTSITPRLRFAIDAVDQGLATTGVANGNIVCRATIQGNAAFDPAAAGCVPLNPFGENQFSAAAKAWTHGTAEQDTRMTQNVVSATMNGTLFEGWAGAIKAATGVELRQDIARGTADPISRALQFYTSPGSAIDGKVDIFEAFGELDVPLAEGVFLNGAVRYTDYSTSGDVMTWKVGLEAQPLDWLRFRGTRSRDIRAPNIFELYGPQQTSFQSVNSRFGQILTNVLLGGNSELVPEVANTLTLGVVLEPNLGSAGRLRFSVDYFDIKLDDAVSTLGAAVIVSGCETNNIQELCDLITREGPGQYDRITSIVNTNINLGGFATRGWDIEAQYTLPVDVFGGSITLRGMATIIDDLITTTAAGSVDRAGMNGSPVSQPSGMPRHTINGYVTFDADPATFQVQVRHISGGTYNSASIGPGQTGYDPSLRNSINDNYIAPWTYVNLNASVNLWNRGDQKLELFGAISNLFDKDPPVDAPSSFGPTNNVLYDVLGRAYRIGARFKF